MKVRVRSLDSKVTRKIEVPDPCSLHNFEQLLFLALALSSSSSSSASIYLSLNRKDQLQASSSQDTLQSLGVTSGDLVYYSFNPTSFSSQTPLHSQSQTLVPILGEEEALAPNSGETLIDSQTLNINPGGTVVQSQTLGVMKGGSSETPIESETLVPNLGREECLGQSPSVQSELGESKQYGSLGSDSGKSETLEFSGTASMDVDGGDADDVAYDDALVEVKKSFSESCFLRKVLREEVGDDGNEHKLLVIAVHAVMLDSGFVGFDSVSGMRVDRFQFPDEWPSAAVTTSIWYTLPELFDKGCNDSCAIESVVLKFQNLGQFINIYGSLARNGSTLYRVTLNEYRFAPTIDLMWTHCDSTEEKDRCNDSYPENEVFEFWKIVKDGLALPLLIDLCEKGGLLPPPCLMQLPTELKLKIFELLPGTDIAKVGCVCSEFRYLSSNNDLWKQKFIEEFGNVSGPVAFGFWKGRFACWWEKRKKRKREGQMWTWISGFDSPYFPIRRDPNPFARPPTIGGDYDRFPALGIPSLFGQPGRRFPRFPGQLSTIPRCNRGGFSG